jgi:hypothetical protein
VPKGSASVVRVPPRMVPTLCSAPHTAVPSGLGGFEAALEPVDATGVRDRYQLAVSDRAGPHAVAVWMCTFAESAATR